VAGYYAKKKEFTKAVSLLDEAIKADPKFAAAMEMKGEVYAADKKYADALKAFSELEKVAPEKAIPLKVKTYISMKEAPKALEEARKIITMKPSSAAGYIILAAVYESQKDTNRAIAELQNGIRIDPKNPEGRLLLGNLYAKKNDLNQAMVTYQDLVRVHPNFAPGYFVIGSQYDAAGKKREAVKKYEESLARMPDYGPALNNLALLYADGYGDKKEALRLAIAAYNQQPNNAVSMDTVGYVLLKNGRNEEAKKVLEKAASYLRDNPSVLYHLALAYKETGDRQQARAQVEQALKIGNFPEVQQARKLHEELIGTPQVSPKKK
jgi:tetratricopeptide (TPR) repeat protein